MRFLPLHNFTQLAQIPVNVSVCQLYKMISENLHMYLYNYLINYKCLEKNKKCSGVTFFYASAKILIEALSSWDGQENQSAQRQQSTFHT